MAAGERNSIRQPHVWAAVIAVADALLERKELFYNEAIPLVHTAYASALREGYRSWSEVQECSPFEYCYNENRIPVLLPLIWKDFKRRRRRPLEAAGINTAEPALWGTDRCVGR